MVTILPYLQLLLTACNILVMGYAFFKFINKPHDTLEGRVTALEVKQKDTEQALRQGNDRFHDTRDALQCIQKSLMALIEFEIQYCTAEGKGISRELERAKDELHDYLTTK